MNYEVEDQYNIFVKDVETGLLSHELYLREDDYEDEYSHSAIDRGHILLSERIRKYLHDKSPNQYCVFVDWCVRVMSVEMAEKKNISNYKNYIIKQLKHEFHRKQRKYMNEYICYKADKLLKLLGNAFRIINKEVEDNFSDWVTGDIDSEQVNKFYITNSDNIQKIEEWKSLWSEIDIYLKDGSKITLHSDTINSDDKNLLRISKNNFFSPSFERQSSYILANSKLNQWLLFNGVLQEQLDQITKKFQVYPTYVFEGVNEPLIENDKVCGYYGGRYLEISEDKIDKALADIKDIEMKFKIEAIIKSFKVKYK